MSSLHMLMRTRSPMALSAVCRQFSVVSQTRPDATSFTLNSTVESSCCQRTSTAVPSTIQALYYRTLNTSLREHSSTRYFSTSISTAKSSPSNSSSSDPPQLTHTDPKTGKASMVSVADKPSTHRTALAVSSIWLPGIAFDLLKRNAHKKGDVLTVAQIAGIQAAKQTSNLIPLCHPLLLTHISVQLKLVEDSEEPKTNSSADQQQQQQGDSSPLKGGRVEIESRVACMGNTGVEMEALTGATVAALTVFDMCKAVGKDMVIGEIKVLEKTGGKSGHYKHQQKDSERRSHGI
ncbi:Molybdopterin cofactor biosynthesis C domain-containing protein [Gamsiella multidivaricata]|uniref:Molybdopterin cofactor biosynthesis C domain-containing protein n=1 Tax=Gamsiella multidivaricata TaxID=101098 RepID=UPI00221FE541|nr:Molybdopterin cofactor biosynthesis C domain-containing protein [Gamsiella multidivaricata]KAI7828678.1 Molybdopterin cofactor biosynthesis C domain-containing protein [Gamsiella multidivaricata]